MFGRKKSEESTPGLITEDPVKVDGKGQPTPKRRDVEAANRRPLVAPTARTSVRGRKETPEEKAKRRADQARINEGMARGEEKYLPARDRGPQRRFARDYVDARWTGGEFFLPIALVMLVATFILGSNGPAAFFVIIVLYAAVIVCVVDAIIMGAQLKKRIVKKFGTMDKGIKWYATMRAFQVRPMRLPKPQVKRGDYPS